MFSVLKILGLLCLLTSCAGLPRPPEIPTCLYDNSSLDDNSNKAPNFKCITARDTRFKINWNSEGASNMVCTPHDDYVRMNEYYKKIFDIFEREIINKAGVRR